MISKMNYIKENFMKNIFWCYIIVDIFLKSLLFLGLQLNHTHRSFDLSVAFEYLSSKHSYRLLYYISFILVLVSLVHVLKTQKKLWYLFSLNVLISMLFLGDVWYLRSYNSMTSLSLVTQASNAGLLWDSIVSLVSKLDLLFVMDIPILIIYVLFMRKKFYDARRNFILFGISFVLPIISIASIIPYQQYTRGKDYDGGEIISYFDSSETASNISLIGYHLYDIYNSLKNSNHITLNDKDKSEIKAWFDYKKENIPDNKYKGMFKGKNLLIVQIESLEKFVIDQKIEDQEISPNLNKFIKNSLFFTNYHEQVNFGMSSDADLITNTSVYPLSTGSTFFGYPYNKYNSMPNLLQEIGYSTAIYYPIKGSFWNWMPAIKSIGFQKSYDSSSYDLSELLGLGISDRTLYKQAEPMVLAQKQPFYSVIVTLSGHMPFYLEDKYKSLKLGETLDKSYLGGYFQCVHYEDEQIGNLIESLKKDHLLDNTVVVFYGDHEGVHRFYPDDVANVTPAQSWWADNKKKLPLIIYNPALTGEEISTIGGQIDLLPTLAYLFGVDDTKLANSAMGRNLLKTNKNFAVLPKGIVISDQLSDKDKDHAVKGLEIADKIIKSNYFKP